VAAQRGPQPGGQRVRADAGAVDQQDGQAGATDIADGIAAGLHLGHLDNGQRYGCIDAHDCNDGQRGDNFAGRDEPRLLAHRLGHAVLSRRPEVGFHRSPPQTNSGRK